MRLFSDCDDTLILYGYAEHSSGLFLLKGAPTQNKALIDAIAQFRQTYYDDVELIVWSYNGEVHAERIAKDCFGGAKGEDWNILVKDIATPKAGDIVIDDKPRGFTDYYEDDSYDFPEDILVMTPEEFIWTYAGGI